MPAIGIRIAFGKGDAGSAPRTGTLPEKGVDMSFTCEHVLHMPVMIQLRNVPDALHHRLKARAAMEGMTLSDYLIAEVSRAAERPTPREMRERLHARASIEPRVSPAAAVRAARDAR